MSIQTANCLLLFYRVWNGLDEALIDFKALCAALRSELLNFSVVDTMQTLLGLGELG